MKYPKNQIAKSVDTIIKPIKKEKILERSFFLMSLNRLFKPDFLI
ncbi:hypothetical protein CANDROIZ_450002 [Candidatus Roizmanbacteria bacterium]|nr:hypothetical protein CANDROIZ_450002 [Candidatus Roizmanbacteria bacterium]